MRVDRILTRRWVTIMAGMAAIILLALVWIRAPKTISYEVIEIPLPGGFSRIDDLRINDRGVVAGTLRGTTDNSDHLFVWDLDKGLKVLGNPGFVSQKSVLQVIGINNQGQIVGVTSSSDSINIHNETGFHYNFFYDPPSGFHKIDPSLRFPILDIADINDQGQVVCTSTHVQSGGWNESRIVSWDLKSGNRDFNLTGVAYDINESGHILGRDQMTLFLWTPQDGSIPLQGFPYGSVVGLRINDFDEVFGIAHVMESPNLGYFRWKRDEGYQLLHLIGIPLLDSYPIFAMNKQSILYYQFHKQFDWFGLVHPRKIDKQLRLFTVGEGVAIPRHLPHIEGLGHLNWKINHNGWIVGNVDRKAYVMIPKGKR